jgi:hypothetical protein
MAKETPNPQAVLSGVLSLHINPAGQLVNYVYEFNSVLYQEI